MMNWTRWTLSAALGLALLGPFAGVGLAAPPAVPHPDAPGLTTRERMDALVERVKAAQKGLQSLEARFVQRKESEMFVAPQESRGEFSFQAPDRVRWEYLSPKPITVLIRQDKMTTWYKDLNRAEEITVGRYSDQIFKYLSATGSLDTLLEYFTVTVAFPKGATEPYRMDLSPRFERIAKRLKTMSIWIDRERFVPSAVRYEDGVGDVTEYRFEGLRLNAAIPAERFDLHLPGTVAVEHVSAGRPAS